LPRKPDSLPRGQLLSTCALCSRDALPGAAFCSAHTIKGVGAGAVAKERAIPIHGLVGDSLLAKRASGVPAVPVSDQVVRDTRTVSALLYWEGLRLRRLYMSLPPGHLELVVKACASWLPDPRHHLPSLCADRIDGWARREGMTIDQFLPVVEWVRYETYGAVLWLLERTRALLRAIPKPTPGQIAKHFAPREPESIRTARAELGRRTGGHLKVGSSKISGGRFEGEARLRALKRKKERRF